MKDMTRTILLGVGFAICLPAMVNFTGKSTGYNNKRLQAAEAKAKAVAEWEAGYAKEQLVKACVEDLSASYTHKTGRKVRDTQLAKFNDLCH